MCSLIFLRSLNIFLDLCPWLKVCFIDFQSFRDFPWVLSFSSLLLPAWSFFLIFWPWFQVFSRFSLQFWPSSSTWSVGIFVDLRSSVDLYSYYLYFFFLTLVSGLFLRFLILLDLFSTVVPDFKSSL